MKKSIILATLLFCSILTYSQNFFETTNNLALPVDITHMGKISIGSITPTGDFSIYRNGLPTFSLKNNFGRLQIGMANANYNFHAKAKPGTVTFRNMSSHNMIFTMPNNSNDGSRNIRIVDDYNLNTFVVHNNGKVTIGTENFDSSDYKLYVKKGIKTEKIKVEFSNVNGWADYVFNKNYYLMPLEDLENFINTNKHLPEIPSAQEVVDNGLELKSMNVLLLKKVEELTLHIIDLNKKLKSLEEIVSQKNK